MIDLEQRAAGVVLPVKAQAGARVNAVRGEQQGALKVAVTQVPEKGKANKAIIEILAKTLRLRKSQMALVAGETSSEKRFLVTDIELAELAARIEQVLAESS